MVLKVDVSNDQINVKNNRRELFIYLFGVLHHFQHRTGHITMGSWKGRGNQYIQLVKVLYCKLLTNGMQLPAFPLEAGSGTEPRPQRWEAIVLLLCHRGPQKGTRDATQSIMHSLNMFSITDKKIFKTFSLIIEMFPLAKPLALVRIR